MERPARYLDVVCAHLPWALLSAAALLVFRFSLSRWLARPCGFLQITGYPCPFCGYTRGLVDLTHGHWEAALRNCPASVLVLVALLAVLAWNTAALAGRVRLRLGPALRPSKGAWRALLWIAGGIVAANWLYRLATGLK